VRVWSFASGSDGNCYLVESEGTTLLVECGRPYQQVRDFLESVGTEPDSVAGILLTHAHGDHSRSARTFSQQHQVPIYASIGTLAALNLPDHALARPMQSGRTYSVGQMDVKPFAVPHDCREPLGFRFEAGSGRACITTDLGWVPHNVAKQFRDLDLLVLEANYDPHLLENGTYPHFLKRRVSGTYGHLERGGRRGHRRLRRPRPADGVAGAPERAEQFAEARHPDRQPGAEAAWPGPRAAQDHPSPALEPALDQRRCARAPAAPLRLRRAR